MSTPATPPTPTEDITVEVSLSTLLPPAVRQDLSARAHLQRQTPAELLAKVLAQRLSPIFTVTPKHAA